MKTRILIASGLAFLFVAFCLALDSWAQQAQYPTQRGVSFQIGTVPRHRHSGDSDGGGTLQFDAILRDGSTNYGPVAGTTNTHVNLGTLSIAGDSIAGQDRRYATVGGGLTNYSYAEYGTIGGGFSNRLTTGTATAGTIGGGYSNRAGFQATVGGGRSNEAKGDNSTIPGGLLNTAEGANAFAAGTQARSVAKGAFTLTDSQLTDLRNDTTDYLLMRFQAGWEVRTPTAVFQNRVQAGSFVGDGAGLTGLSAAELNTFNSSKTFNAVVLASATGANVYSFGAASGVYIGGPLRFSDGTQIFTAPAGGAEGQTFTQPKTFTASVTIRADVNAPLQVTSTLNLSSFTLTNTTANNPVIKLGHPSSASSLVYGGVETGLNDVDNASRGEHWYRFIYGSGYDKFGIGLDGQELRTLKVSAGGSSLDDNGDGGKIGFWTGSSAAQKHMMSQNGRFGLNTLTAQPRATLEVLNATYQAEYALRVSSQDGTAMGAAVDRLGNTTLGSGANVSTFTTTGALFAASDVKISSAALIISGNTNVPIQITSALNRSSLTLTNTSTNYPVMKLGHPSGASSLLYGGIETGLNDVDGAGANRGEHWYRFVFGNGYDKFGIGFDGQELRTLKIGAGGSALDNTGDGGNIDFYTGNAAAANGRINFRGDWGLGTTSPKGRLHVSSGTASLMATSTGTYITGTLGQTVARSCTTGATTDAAGNFDGCVASSRKAKTGIKNRRADLAAFDRLRVVNYAMKKDKTRRPRLGFIAEEVEVLYPEAVVPAGADLTGIDALSMSAVLVQEVQDLRARVKKLEDRQPPTPAKSAGTGAAGAVAGAVLAAAALKRKAAK